MAWFSFKRREPAAAATAHSPPLLAGRYRIGAKIGSGAAGEVFEAIDMRSGNVVAIKRRLEDGRPPS